MNEALKYPLLSWRPYLAGACGTSAHTIPESGSPLLCPIASTPMTLRTFVIFAFEFRV